MNDANHSSDARSSYGWDAVAEVLGDAYDCKRVWSAWSYGTMSQDDFCLVAEDAGRLGEIVDAVIKVLAPNSAINCKNV